MHNLFVSNKRAKDILNQPARGTEKPLKMYPLSNSIGHVKAIHSGKEYNKN